MNQKQSKYKKFLELHRFRRYFTEQSGEEAIREFNRNYRNDTKLICEQLGMVKEYERCNQDPLVFYAMCRYWAHEIGPEKLKYIFDHIIYARI
jgi:hypothetical protein